MTLRPPDSRGQRAQVQEQSRILLHSEQRLRGVRGHGHEVCAWMKCTECRFELRRMKAGVQEYSGFF